MFVTEPVQNQNPTSQREDGFIWFAECPFFLFQYWMIVTDALMLQLVNVEFSFTGASQLINSSFNDFSL